MSELRNIALMAHVDAGKTTLTERILYASGVLRALGSVDRGTAKTDDLAVERQRGISVRAALASFSLEGLTINLIDTPGHADFYSQVERAFLGVDAVVVLVSAVDGVQAGTEILVQEAREHGIPMAFFINQCDRDIASPAEAAAQIKALMPGAFVYASERYETAALYDDALAEAFLTDAPEDAGAVSRTLRERMKTLDAAPILLGSAITGDGVDTLFTLLRDIFPEPDQGERGGTPSGVVFNVTHDKMFGRAAYVRLFAGTLRVRDMVPLGGAERKVSILRRQVDGRWTDVRALEAGDIGLCYGWPDCKTGDVFGDPALLPARARTGLLRRALLTARISPENPADAAALRSALGMMTAEDPSLDFVWDATSGEMQVGVMGAIQVETLGSLLEERFGLRVSVGRPAVIYKETPAGPAIGFDAYTMPKPCWAVLRFALTPAGRSSGVSFRCSAPPNRLSYRYRRQVEQSVVPSLAQGLYGWEVTDVDIDLTDGEDHPIHTHPLDFSIATPLALMDGLRNGGTLLLEPIMDMKFTLDSGHLGRLTGDILRMRGEAVTQTWQGDLITLSARVPLANSLDYPATFASLTSGRGVMSARLHGYAECPLELGQIRPRRGVNPLERAKYILAARQALSGTVFDV